MRKIIQIASSESSEDTNRIALCDDGTVWEYIWPKPIYEDVPATPEKNYSSRKHVGTSDATWIKLADIPQEKI